MNSTTNLILGGVYKTKFHPDPHRVIAFDNYEVFYDGYWPTLDKWTFSDSLNSKCFYYRTIPSVFLDSATFLREQPLTERESSIFRPDLPFRICRNKQIQWMTNDFSDINLYKDFLIKNNFSLSQEIVLNVPEIVLHPYGPKGGGVKATKITASNKQGFTNSELLWHGQNLQSIHLKENSKDGVGLFRLGHEKKIPSYYIGNYIDKANFLKD